MAARLRSVLAILAVAVAAVVASPDALAAKKKRSAAAPKYAALVIHADSGAVLFERYPDAKRYPASLTKMMTVYIIFDELAAGRLKLDTRFRVEMTSDNIRAGEPVQETESTRFY